MNIDFSQQNYEYCLNVRSVYSRLLKVPTVAAGIGIANILLLIKCTQSNLYPFIFKGVSAPSPVGSPKGVGDTGKYEQNALMTLTKSVFFLFVFI